MLHDVHVDRLKIDQRFVSGIATSPRQQQIVSGIVALARGLQVELVAEGVEAESDWTMLGMLGCDVAQGYLVGRPVPIAELHATLALDQAAMWSALNMDRTRP